MTNDFEQSIKEKFSEWVNLYTDDLLKWATFKTSSVEVAEDLVQDVFYSAYRNIDSFKQKSQPKTWLFSILNNKIVDYYRKNKPEKKIVESLKESDAELFTSSLFNEKEYWSAVQHNAMWEEEKNLLDIPAFNQIMEDCVDDLPSNWKLIITSKFLLNKDADEICQDLNMAKTNYWQLIHRSKLLLRKCIENGWQF
jgi:RNA polymerase sigma-70 factor (ECF subfamily)